MSYPWWRVRAVPQARHVTVLDIVLRLSHVAIEICHALVQLAPLLAAVVLEARHRVDAAYSGDGERNEEEDGAAIALLFVDFVIE